VKLRTKEKDYFKSLIYLISAMKQKKIFDNKKGLLEGTLLDMIKIALVTAVLVFFIFAIFIKPFLFKTEMEKCKLSYIAAAKSKMFDGKKKIQFKCERVELEIKGNDVIEKGEVQKTQIMRLIAEEMRDCHYKTNEGKANPFDQNKVMNSKPCFFCSYISFDKKLKEKNININGSDFLDYLSVNMLNSDLSYIKYLENEDSSSKFGLVSINTTKDYYVLYTHIQVGSLFDPSNILGKPGAAMNSINPLFTVPEKGYYSSMIMFINSDEIDRLGCTYLAN
jgi:hypothetical protein